MMILSDAQSGWKSVVGESRHTSLPAIVRSYMDRWNRSETRSQMSYIRGSPILSVGLTSSHRHCNLALLPTNSGKMAEQIAEFGPEGKAKSHKERTASISLQNP